MSCNFETKRLTRAGDSLVLVTLIKNATAAMAIDPFVNHGEQLRLFPREDARAEDSELMFQ